MSTPILCVVPLRSPGAGKSRLSSVLEPEERAALSRAMLGDVTQALHGAGIGEVVVAASDAHAARVAEDLGCRALLDEPSARGLDEILASAVGRVGWSGDLLTVQADLPSLTASEVRAVVEDPAPVVIAPTADGGTSLLLRRPVTAMGTRYGPDSARHHARMAAVAGLAVSIVELAGPSQDVDTPEDLDVLSRALDVGPATSAWLQRHALSAVATAASQQPGS